MENIQNKKVNLTKPNVSRQYRHKKPDGTYSNGNGQWEEMADVNDWDFLVQFMQDYDHSDEAMWLDDYNSVVEGDHGHKNLDWLHKEYPCMDEYTIEDVKQEQETLYAKLLNEAKENLTQGLISGEFEVRELPVTIVSAKPKHYCNIMLQPVNKYYRSSNYPNGYGFLAEEFQDVQSRIIDGKFQVRKPNKMNLEEQWYNANPIDFE